MSLVLGSKSDTLRALEGHLSTGQILPQVAFSVEAWRSNARDILDRVLAERWAAGPVIVRSSAAAEDDIEAGAAGRFVSVPNVAGAQDIRVAVDRVIASYPNGAGHQVFVQPFLVRVAIAGVAFGRDPSSGGRYVVINYDDESGATDTVTSGRQARTRTYVEAWAAPERDHALAPVVRLMRELQRVFGTDWLDVEFAIEEGGALYVLQVRLLPSKARSASGPKEDSGSLERIARRLEEANGRHPYLSGRRTVFGIMPDWNPAEIVGVRPRPLSLSLYRELVTDNIWAYQRYKYGYRDVRSFPLVIDLEGLPYVDVRASFNSFVPRDLKPPIADRLVDYYIDKLIDAPALHDKVEFDIVFSCYTADLPDRAKVLEQHGFTPMDVGHIAEVLRLLTNRIMGRRDGFWQEDVARTRILEQRRLAVVNSALPDVEKLFWLLEDCKRYGTLPFAGLARCAFIATQILHSLVALGVLDHDDRDRFLGSLDTVSARMARDLRMAPFKDFLDRYGHLRPGTYDITSARYDEAPERYFDAHRPATPAAVSTVFVLSDRQRRVIDALMHEHGIDYDAESLLQFVRTSIEAREDAKFVFTRSLSDALALIERIGAASGLDRDAMSFVTIGALRDAVAQTADLSRVLTRAIAEGRERWDVARRILLPPLLIHSEDVFSFHVPPSEPNFVTQLTATGPVVDAEASTDGLAGSIVLIRSADPGWDWILTRNIKAFVTQYGGANSHMAVRAHQLGLPAVVGAGEALFERCRRARRLLVDCPNHQVRVLS